MPLELLSSIKGAESSEAVKKLFEVIKNAIPKGNNNNPRNNNYNNYQSVRLEELRDDQVRTCPAHERTLIIENFPREKDGYLVVPKVIED